MGFLITGTESPEVSLPSGLRRLEFIDDQVGRGVISECYNHDGEPICRVEFPEYGGLIVDTGTEIRDIQEAATHIGNAVSLLRQNALL